MSGPTEPPGPEYDFPAVHPADPVVPRVEPAAPAYDTGSDAWLEAQGRASAPLTGSTPTPTPLDAEWLPAELATPPGWAPSGPDPDTDELPLPVLPVLPVATAAAAASTVTHLAGAEPRVTHVAGAAAPAAHEAPAPALPPGVAPAGSAAAAAEPAVVEPERRVRPPAEADSGGRGRAVVGAGVALAGVSLGIAALLWLDRGSDGSPTVALPPAASTLPSAAPATPPTTDPTATGGSSPSTTPSTPPRASAAPSTGSAPPVVVSPPTAPAPALAARLPVTVLNNSRYAGLAERAAARYRAGGWTTPVVGNFTGRLKATTVYYAPGQLPSAERFAREFGLRRVLPRFRGLPGSGLTVVVTRDLVT